MNIKNIKPIKIWNNGEFKTANCFCLYNYGGYNFASAEGSYASYKLGTITSQQSGDVTVETFVSLAEGSVILPQELVENWGIDDEPVWNYVMAELKLTEVV